MGEFLQWESGVACAVRNWVWRWMPQAFSVGRIRRLLGGEVPDLNERV
jgi:hypothetical protein